MMTTEPPKNFKCCLALFAIGIFLSGCSTNTNPASTTTAATNIPVIASATNAFTFVLEANDYTQSQNLGLTFTADSIALSVVSGNYKSGSISFSVTDSTNATIVQDSITTSGVIAMTLPVKRNPKHCLIDCSHYAGSVTFSMSGYK